MMKLKLFFFLALFFFIYSCKKNECVAPGEPQINNSFYPLTVGSYWIYHWYTVDIDGNDEILSSKIDTVRVIKDTLIRGNNYAIIEDNNSVETNLKRILYRRDSLGYLIDESNNIFFSSSNFIDTLRLDISPGLFEVNYEMEISDMPISTPLGEFDCLNFQGKVIPIIAANWSERFLDNYYSRGVGLVMETVFFFNSPSILERRLVEYNIK